MRRRRLCKASGVRKRLRRKKHGPYLPTIIMGDLRSLPNKMDEHSGNVKFIRDFRDISIMSFSETWLTDSHDAIVGLDGFKLMGGDRDPVHSGVGLMLTMYDSNPILAHRTWKSWPFRSDRTTSHVSFPM